MDGSGQQASSSGRAATGTEAPQKVDVAALMKSDPRFIARLIQQLDAQMHTMQNEKKKRGEQMAEDAKELARLDAEISAHIKPKMDALNKGLEAKQAQRDSLRRELEAQTNNFTAMERDAQALLRRAMHANRKVTRANASGLLLEQRGYSAAQKTTDLIKAGRRKPLEGNVSKSAAGS